MICGNAIHAPNATSKVVFRNIAPAIATNPSTTPELSEKPMAKSRDVAISEAKYGIQAQMRNALTFMGWADVYAIATAGAG
jgi:cobalamin biosynthesis protein CobT